MIEVPVFYIATLAALPPEVVQTWTQRLSPDHRRRFAALKSATARLEMITGLALLRHGLAVVGSAAPDIAALRYPAGRAPHWQSGPLFSISHSDGLVACAIAPADRVAAIGIDLERVRPLDPVRFRHVLPRAVEARVDSMSLLRAWTRREAVLKAAGASLRHIGEVDVDAAGAIARFEGRRWYLAELDLPPTHCGYCASDRAGVAYRATALDAVGLAPAPVFDDNAAPAAAARPTR
jgi:phosphopantetheinyl transferase